MKKRGIIVELVLCGDVLATNIQVITELFNIILTVTGAINLMIKNADYYQTKPHAGSVVVRTAPAPFHGWWLQKA